jgi:hypothetical protein
MTRYLDEGAVRAALMAELARNGLPRTDEEIAHILAEKLRFERDMDQQRTNLGPEVAPNNFLERLQSARQRP